MATVLTLRMLRTPAPCLRSELSCEMPVLAAKATPSMMTKPVASTLMPKVREVVVLVIPPVTRSVLPARAPMEESKAKVIGPE